MAIENRPVWEPDWGVPPGDVLLETLQERGMSQAELARRMDRPLKTINEIIKAKAAITPETALQLERALGISARFWNGLEGRYREHLAREQFRLELEKHAAWADKFPIRDLLRYKLIAARPTKAETLAELLAYFRVSSPAAFDRQWLELAAVSLRGSAAFRPSPYALAAWLRWGELRAEEIRCDPFDAEMFRRSLVEIRSYTRQEPVAQILKKVQKMCSAAGVAVIVTPELEGTRVSGAARWLSPAKALIQLSGRHKSDDHLWFSFFHESGHVLSQARRRDYIDPAPEDEPTKQQPDEEEADRFAREFLLPPRAYEAFVEHGEFTAGAVQAFAQEQGVAPGIVVGRLQRDKKISPSRLNDLKKKVALVV